MNETPRQLTLDLPVFPRMDTEDFLVSSSNESAYSLLEAWPEWPSRLLVLSGPPGSGKTHLSTIWAKRANAWALDVQDLTSVRVPHLVANSAVVIEKCEGLPRDEDALFHLINAMEERGGWVLLTGRGALAGWDLKTPDLLSRLRRAISVEIEQPDDALLGALLVKLLLDRQMIVDTSIVEYIRQRIERSVESVQRFVELIDQEGLIRGRRITKGLVSECLQKFENTQSE